MKRLKHQGFAALVAVLLTFGCGGQQTEAPSSTNEPAPSDAQPSRELVVSQGSDTLSLDPYAFLESPSFGVQINLFDGLTDLDGEMNVVPGLAESWENVTPSEWVFHLREGIEFHEGQSFAADDVVFSLRRALDWAKSRVASEIQTVVDVEAIDPQTVRITTNEPDAILPLRLVQVLIMDREWTEAALNDPERGEGWVATHANGTGPYRLDQWRPDEFCRVVANVDYWDGAPEAVEVINFLAISNDATRLAALQEGKIDILMHVPPRNVGRVEQMPGYHVTRQPSLRLIYLGLDVGREDSPCIPGMKNPLLDLRVRQAISCAINRDLIVSKIMGGLGLVANQLMPAVVTGYDPEMPPIEYDPDRAWALLAEAGYPDGFSIQLDGPNDRYVNDAEIMQAIAVQLAQVGIDVQVRARPKKMFFADEKAGALSFFLIGWANSNGDGAGTFEHLLATPVEGRPIGGSNTSTLYSNPELDARVAEAQQSFVPAERDALLREAHRIAMDDLPHIPLHFQVDIYAISDRVNWSPRSDTQVRGRDVQWQ